ncbi:hypothetical protein DBY21_05265 [Candidatus Gastranaerophilales bacterium]|nr:MAG: hypothetical protein DBY21_05265 [Candidatus Gastranaerophilales bacterium]
MGKRVLFSIILGMFFLLCLVSSAFAANSRYNVYSPSTYKQINIVQSPKNSRINGYAVELLVDYSGSMGRWIQLAKETLEFILPKIPKTTSVALRVLGENNGQRGFAFADLCKSTRLVTFFKHENQTNIVKGLQEAQLGGMTPLEFALRETIEKDLRSVRVFNNDKSGAKDKKIILVTDGYDTCGGDPCKYIREVMRLRKDFQIDVVQLGNSTELMCLSAETGGSFYKIDGSRDKFVRAFENTFGVPVGTVEQGIKEKNGNVQPSKPVSQKPSRGYKFINF